MDRRTFIKVSTAVAAGSMLSGCFRSSRTAKQTLTVFTWADYLSEEAHAAFEKAFNCNLVIDTFDSNEAMLAKLEAGAAGYDILVPTSYAARMLKEMDLLQNLDHSLLPNLKYVDAAELEVALDPEMAYSVPYMMAPTCLGYLKSKVPNPVFSWNLILRDSLKGRVTMLDDMREVLGAALKTMGNSLNSTVVAEVQAAADLAIRWKKQLAKYENEQYKTGLASGEFYLVQGYGGDLITVQSEAEDVGVFIPEEGTVIAVDDLCIPKSAPNPGLAHAFINHLTDPAIAAENMEWIGYKAPNTAAYEKVSSEFLANEVLFPPAEVMARCEPIAYLGDDLGIYTKAWDRVKNA